jgi:hypothetical protein
MEAYALLACFVLLILFLCMCAVALVLGERVMHLEWQNAKLRKAIRPFDRDGDGYPGGGKPNIDPYVKRALDRADHGGLPAK